MQINRGRNEAKYQATEVETPSLSPPGTDAARKMPLARHFPASGKSVKALIKHHEVRGTFVVTRPIFIPPEMCRLCVYSLKEKMMS